ncbi:NmrA/HSCARG family protein [Halovivax sp.]|uniref:NmrA/HSCARG family protein n=1 Tax=Halovivax sp. TaxID=1935978 RepID=UPI0025BAF2FB|nr:NmrA/HSCARG family protein [Halovivax sp.]
MTAETILVVGATGTQGGAVAHHLLEHEHDFDVRALTRDENQAAARALAEAGAEVVQGNIREKNNVEGVLTDVDGVFLMTNFWEHGYDEEVEQGTNVIELADDHGIDHLVFSSVGGAERDTGIPHFDSKWELEELIRERELSATIVRPVFFAQNFEGFRDSIEGGTLAMGLEPGTALQLLDVDTLGAFVAECFVDPDRHVGEAYELASDELTLRAMAIRFADVLDVPVRAEHLSIDDVREAQGEEFAVMFEWFNEAGYESPLDELRAAHDVDFYRLEEYVAGEWTAE